MPKRTVQDMVEEAFRNSYIEALRSIERDVFDEEGYLRRTENSWECNHLEEYREILAMENARRRHGHSCRGRSGFRSGRDTVRYRLG